MGTQTKKGNTDLKWAMPKGIVDAEEIANEDVDRAFDATAKVYKAANHAFRATTYHTLAFVYRRMLGFRRNREGFHSYIERTAPSSGSKRIRASAAMRLCTIHAEGAKTKAAIKLADKHARALFKLWQERKAPGCVVSELRERTIEGLARELAQARNKGGGSEKTRLSKPLKLSVPSNRLEAALKRSGRARVTTVLKRDADGDVVVLHQAIKPIWAK